MTCHPAATATPNLRSDRLRPATQSATRLQSNRGFHVVERSTRPSRSAGAAAPAQRAAGLRALAIAVLTGALASTLAGCGSSGFQPLYGPGLTGEATRTKLAAVDYAPIPGRVGQRIRNDLVFDRSAAGDVTPAKKRVEIKLTEALITTLADAKGDSAGQTYQVEAVYKIVDVASQKVETEGRSVARANFERFESIYANVRGREDAENRAARQIASDVKTRVAVHLSRN
jgi:LPS-assembly lipoprotein